MNPWYSYLAIGIVAAVLVLVAAASSSALADGHDTVGFSRPVPSLSDAEDGHLTCALGNYEPGSWTHHWKLRLRGSGTREVALSIAALPFSPLDEGAIEASVEDETGLKNLTVPYSPDDEAANHLAVVSHDLPLLLEAGRVYDVAIKLIGALRSLNPGHHYAIGSTANGVELGWAGPLRFLEDRTIWAINTDPGEHVHLSFTGAAPSIRSASNLTVSVQKPDGTTVFGPITYDRVTVDVAIPDSPGEALFVLILADGHFSMTKGSGSDRGMYAVPCPWPIGPPALFDQTGLPSDPGRPPLFGLDGRVNTETGPPPDSNSGSGLWIVAAGVGALVGAATVAVGAGTRPVRGRWARRHSVRDRLPGVAAEAAATAPPQEVDPTGKSLTPRENEVVAELTLGLTNRQIAEKLVISESTVKRHVENILDKLGFESRTQIAAWATLLGSRDGDEESRTTRDAG